jgi:hypothetical protein
MNKINSTKIQEIKQGIFRDLKKLHESNTVTEEEEEELDESEGGTAFGGATGSATYDAPAFGGKAGTSIIKKKPYTIGETFIKKNLIRPVVEQYLAKYLK